MDGDGTSVMSSADPTAEQNSEESRAASTGLLVDMTRRARSDEEGSDVSLLSYLERLTFTFHREGQEVSCVLVYAEPDPHRPGVYRTLVAADTDHEGIACVDDTARAVLLALGVYERSGSPQALRLARQWLSFVQYMQYPDGSFANFIRNPAGVRNATGPTSFKGGYWWSVRALWALARAYRLTRDTSYLERYQACRLAPTPDRKINAVLALAALELYHLQPANDLRRKILDHCAVISQDEPYFRDQPESEAVQLWGYHQLHAVATAAARLDEHRLLPACRRTVQSLVEPDVRARFWYSYPDRRKDGVCAYTVTPLVQGLAALYRATGAVRYRRLALQGATWFYGRNDARIAMYDPTTGRCRDGISDGVASSHYGAESAVEAGLAELERRDLLHYRVRQGPSGCRVRWRPSRGLTDDRRG